MAQLWDASELREEAMARRAVFEDAAKNPKRAHDASVNVLALQRPYLWRTTQGKPASIYPSSRSGYSLPIL
jgi:hypothetical protein